MTTMITAFIFLFSSFVCFILWRKQKQRSRAPLPPSPPADPVLGHIRYIPAENPELKFAEWAKTYGDVMYLRVLHRPVLVLSSAEAALDLLDKRSWNYSDRPAFPIFDMMGWGDALTFLPYGKKFQRQRQLLQEYLSSAKVASYADMQTLQAKQLALSLAEAKEEREDILQKYGTAVVVRIAFGHNMFYDTDPTYDEMMKRNRYTLTHCGPPGGTPVDLFPIRNFSSFVQWVRDYPVEQIRQQLASGTAKSSFLSHHIDRLQQAGVEETHEDFQEVKTAAATIFAAGSDTMWATLSVFVLAMVLHPECQEQAHQELDRVLGASRLPEFSDRDSLPYIGCVVQETYRWLTAVPLGVPHRTLKDDVYKGMFIPGGTVVFASTWSIARDERIYRDPSRFNPLRYKAKSDGGNGEPPLVSPFGFGRRKCPGHYLADANIWIAAATLLTLFKLEKMKGSDGVDIEPEVGVQTGLTSHPKPYQCNIRLRNDNAHALLAGIKAEIANLT